MSEVIKVGKIMVVPVTIDDKTGQKLHTFVGPEQRPTLDECMKLVDGYIEIVTINRDTLVPVGSQLIVNDEGCMSAAGRGPLPVNRLATQLYHSTCVRGTGAMIHGDAVLLVSGAQLD